MGQLTVGNKVVSDDDRIHLVHYDQTWILAITNVSFDDEGRFFCVPRNGRAVEEINLHVSQGTFYNFMKSPLKGLSICKRGKR